MLVLERGVDTWWTITLTEAIIIIYIDIDIDINSSILYVSLINIAPICFTY